MEEFIVSDELETCDLENFQFFREMKYPVGLFWERLKSEISKWAKSPWATSNKVGKEKFSGWAESPPAQLLLQDAAKYKQTWNL